MDLQVMEIFQTLEWNYNLFREMKNHKPFRNCNMHTNLKYIHEIILHLIYVREAKSERRPNHK